MHYTGTGHVFIPGTGLEQVSQSVGRMEMRGLSDPGPAHPQAQKQSGKEDASMTSVLVLQLGLRAFSVQAWVRFLVGGGSKTLQAAPGKTSKKRWLKSKMGAGVSSQGYRSPASASGPCP